VRSLLLAASFPPATGGVETLLYETNRRLAEPPLVLAPAPAAARDLMVRAVPTSLGARLVYRPLWRLHPSLHYIHLFLGPTLRSARAYRPTVIQAGHIFLAPLARLVASRLGLPYVVYAYGQEVWRCGRRVGVRRLDELQRGSTMRHASRVLVPGTFTAGLVREWQVSPERLVHVPYGAEPRPAAPPVAGDTLLTVGRLVPRKGVDVVIRALRKLPTHVTYRVVGTGPDETRLRRLADDEGVAERVMFVGRLDADRDGRRTVSSKATGWCISKPRHGVDRSSQAARVARSMSWLTAQPESWWMARRLMRWRSP
jgi:phosphatidylinositol alpha-1,6-mannosyltransferase